MSEPKNIFLTGVTGTLGKDIVKEFLETSEDQLFLLIRRKNRFSHWDRARKILADFGLEHHLGIRVHVFDGDVTESSFGLNEEDIDLLRNSIDRFFHIAALTNLNGSEEDCFRINVGGTEEALKLAQSFYKEGKLERFYYFSTAFTPGSLQTYHSLEDGLPEEPAHANHYEASKYASETRVREVMAEGLPTTIFRPSIVVGDSETGEVSEFNVIYPFIRLFAHGMLTRLPTRLENSFNIVPIDFVVKASVEISRRDDSLGKTYHLVTRDAPTIGTLIEVKKIEYPEMPDVEVISPDEFKSDDLDPSEQFVHGMLQPYLGYLNDSLTFDTKNTEEALKDSNIEFPKTGYNFLKKLLSYAVDQGYLVVNA